VSNPGSGHRVDDGSGVGPTDGDRDRERLGILPTRVRHYMTFCGFWIFDDREAQLETYSAAVGITKPSEIALYAKVFEHYSRRAVYGEQASDLLSQAIADLTVGLSQVTSGNIEQHRCSSLALSLP
jgi:hypothetical protein